MCGIAGEFDLQRACNPGAPYYDAMSHSLARRGPDQHGEFYSQNCVLLHRRLAVIDPENGIQPMTYDGMTLVYNGELYNTQELRSQLQAVGYCFDTHSDSEVILKAYHAWGTQCCAMLNGIFAFAVYDSAQKVLTLARDPMGVKPLFYAVKESSVIFASEMKALLQHPSVSPEVTKEGLFDLIFLGPGRTPGDAIFKGIRELLPGQLAMFCTDGLHLEQYWKLTDAPCTDSFDQAAEKTRMLVTDAIRRQLVSDVPLCTFLSGGLDSSIISAVAKKELGQVSTYSVDYTDNERYFQAGKFQPNSDNAYIQIMQQFLMSDHHTVTLNTSELTDAVFDAVSARDLPGMADVDASMLLLCKAVKQTHTVVLSGECADEIFGGYPWYRDPDIRAFNGFPWSQTTDYRASFLRPDFLGTYDPHDYVQQRYQDTLSAVDVLPGTSAQEKRMKEMMVLNLRWFMQTLLDRKDRMSMWSGLEIRVPFCDKRIVEYLYTVPWEYKNYKEREKGLLRYAMRDLLPASIIERKKSPYPKTWNPNYMEAVSRSLRSELETDSPLLQFCRRDALLGLTNENRSLPWYGQLMTTPQTIAYFLQIADWMRKYKIRIV